MCVFVGLTAYSTGGLLQRIEREVGSTRVHHSIQILQTERIKRESAERDHRAYCFAENYLCKLTRDILAVHFGDSHKQVTLHTCVGYTTKDTVSLCSLSSSMQMISQKHWPTSLSSAHRLLLESYFVLC